LIFTLAFALLGIRMLLSRQGQFPDTHISQNKEMQKRGIACAQKTDIGCNTGDGFDECMTCGKKL